MVFSSLPPYLDPANWQQQPNQHLFHQPTGANQQLITPSRQTTPPPLPAQPHDGGVGSPGSIRPNSMAERARLANIPMPEGPLKCPRCDSTNTKFCYFNNYSLTQPRHFCKTCRRYWTRGGALRSVPVGGGCRRNKRSKSTSSNSNKSPISQATSSSTSTVSSHNTGLLQATHHHHNTNNMLNTSLNSPLPPMHFMSPLGQFTDNYNSQSDIGLNFSGISTPLVSGSSEMNFQIGANLLPLGGGIEQWRLQQQQASQQFPFLNGSGGGIGSYPFQLGGSGGGMDPGSGFLGESIHHNQVRPNEKLSVSFLSQLAAVKMEDPNNPGARGGSLLGMNNITTTDEQWNNNNGDNNSNIINNNNNNNNNVNSAWTDLSSFSSSSTSNNPI